MALLTLNKLTVRFGGLTAVQDVDCSIEEHQIFSIIGPNGAGKTTVFNAITGIYEPSAGSITFHDRPLRRALNGRVLAVCALIGLATGLTCALLSLDVNALWRATIKRNYAGPGEPFSYADAWNGAVGYVRGALSIERTRGNRWSVRTPDGRRTLGFAKSYDEAEQMRDRFNQLIAQAATGAESVLAQRGDQWVVRDADDTKDLATFDSQDDARAALEKFATMSTEPAARRRNALLGLLLGLVAGSAGAAAVWRRARCTPEVISRAGIARTFQNIRLFQNMTVIDNVLTAMDRRFHGGVVRMALQTPGLRRQELAARERARQLLEFVGLVGKETLLAKGLPYGDQRRLEIARAMATEPQLILLDEPAAGMNPAESIELNALIQQIRASGPSVVLIEHHMKVVMGISDRVAVLDYGIKIAEGTPEEVRGNPQVIAAYLGNEEVT
jgi:branched-chain amino acid transport system ATP-binding protein